MSGWPLINHVLDDFTEPWLPQPADVVLLHPGLGGNPRLYNQWLPVLGDRYRVLRVSSRGQGLTPRPDGYEWSLDNFVADVVAVLDHHGIKRVHWVGASGGGIMGQAAALRAPERIASLTLIATTARFQGPADRDYAAWIAPLERGDTAAFLRGDEERRFGLDNPARTEWIINELARTPGTHSAELHRWVHTVNLIDQLPNITCPTLVLAAASDPLMKVSDAEILADGIPNARLHIVHDRPHNMAYTHPREIAALVREFLDTLVT